MVHCVVSKILRAKRAELGWILSELLQALGAVELSWLTFLSCMGLKRTVPIGLARKSPFDFPGPRVMCT